MTGVSNQQMKYNFHKDTLDWKIFQTWGGGQFFWETCENMVHTVSKFINKNAKPSSPRELRDLVELEELVEQEQLLELIELEWI